MHTSTLSADAKRDIAIATLDEFEQEGRACPTIVVPGARPCSTYIALRGAAALATSSQLDEILRGLNAQRRHKRQTPRARSRRGTT